MHSLDYQVDYLYAVLFLIEFVAEVIWAKLSFGANSDLNSISSIKASKITRNSIFIVTFNTISFFE